MTQRTGSTLSQRLHASGAANLSNAELLAHILGRMSPATSERLLERFGGLRRLCGADVDALLATYDIGPSRCAKLGAVYELFMRFAAETLPAGVSLKSPAETREFLSLRLRDKPFEVFCCVYLDNRHRVIRFEELFRGTIDGASVYPREVVRAALTANAAAVILAHNHPSGVAEPSSADERLTSRLRSALGLVDIRLLDHIVVGDGDSVSLAERGVL